MQDAFRIVLLLVLLNIGLVAYFLAIRALFPRRVARARAVADLMPGRAFAVGLVNFLFFGAVLLVLLGLGGNITNGFLRVSLAVPAIVILTLLSISLSFGLAGVVELVGERLAPAQTAFRRTLWGTLTLTLGSSLPFVGWFLLLPYAGLLGLGAFIIGFFYREQPPQT